jgi:hypothetical protein
VDNSELRPLKRSYGKEHGCKNESLQLTEVPGKKALPVQKHALYKNILIN